MRFLTRSRIIGTGYTIPQKKSGKSASELMQLALEKAMGNARVGLSNIDGLIAIPALSEPRFMEAHYFGTRIGLLPNNNGIVVKTTDTGGASPIAALLEADRMIRMQGCDLVAIVAGDAVSSMNTEEFLKRADSGCAPPDGSLPSPVIPHGYDRIAKWHVDSGTVTREQLAMVSVLMSRQASRHPDALSKRPHTLKQVLESPNIASHTSLLECARRADGAACILLASTKFMLDHGLEFDKSPVIIGSGEASGPLYPPAVIHDDMFSCETAVKHAFESAQVNENDIDFYGLYDCFPICFIRAVEAVKLAARGEGGKYVERIYHESERLGGKPLPPNMFPVNTHGGLLSFGAPWEVPAMYNIIEAVSQLNGNAKGRQVSNVRRALVYGNGGIFSASAVAILGRGVL